MMKPGSVTPLIDLNTVDNVQAPGYRCGALLHN
jgi:hypothetical protein